MLKFLVVAVSFYGMSTFEGPMMSIRAVNSLSHYTNWTIGHVHSGALGWVGMISFGILYWLVPRLWKRPLAYPDWATTHFWLATIGIVLYTVSMWAAGLTEGLQWRAFDDAGPAQVPQLRGHRPPAAAVLLAAAPGRPDVPHRRHHDGRELLQDRQRPATAPSPAPAAAR